MMIVVFDLGGILLYKRLMEMCRWMGSHFPELLEWGRKFSDFLAWESSSYLRSVNVPECLYCR